MRYQLDRALAADQPPERQSRQSDNPPQLWRLRDKLTEDDVAKIIREWQTGSSQLSLAGKFGVSQSSVRRLLIERGVLKGNLKEQKLIAKRFTPEQLEEIVKEYRGGLTQTETVQRYNLSVSALKRILKQYDMRSSDS